jgi:hypothetical protein
VRKPRTARGAGRQSGLKRCPAYASGAPFTHQSSNGGRCVRVNSL